MKQFRQFVIVSKVGNITEIMNSVQVTISDTNLETGSVPKYVQYVRNRNMFQNGVFKKALNLSITVLFQIKFYILFIFSTLLRPVFCESSIHTRDGKYSEIHTSLKLYLEDLPQISHSVSVMGQFTSWALIPTEFNEIQN